MSGLQALTRIPIAQRRRDIAAGLNTAGFISGYRGSPLGSLDMEIWRAQKYLDELNVKFTPGVNEDLAATAIWGTQQVSLLPGAEVDGVFGIWYGKSPGVDRSMDAIRHANAYGTAPHGGVLALFGDDHGAKSSTLPCQSDHALYAAMVPQLYPYNIQEFVEYGLLGIAMSRYSGCWVGMKLTSESVETTGTVDLYHEELPVILPSGSEFAMPPGGLHIRLNDTPQDVDWRLQNYKLFACHAFARKNNIDQIVLDSPKPRFGIITSGKSYGDVRQALIELGITDQIAAKIGLRLYKVGMTWPLEPKGVQAFVSGLEEILIIEEKRELIEYQLKQQIYNWDPRRRPIVIGKYDEKGDRLLPLHNDMNVGLVAHVIAQRIQRFHRSDKIDRALEFYGQYEKMMQDYTAPSYRRPYYCAGCPHNSSTKTPDGSFSMAGIGCHYMVQWMDRSSGLCTHMGGEGVPWIGAAPFTTREHIFANLGDGTYFHSGTLAIRAAVASGVNLTYKILYNDAVAMTGGQPVDGIMPVTRVVHQVLAEGVSKIWVLSETPHLYQAGKKRQGVRISRLRWPWVKDSGGQAGHIKSKNIPSAQTRQAGSEVSSATGLSLAKGMAASSLREADDFYTGSLPPGIEVLHRDHIERIMEEAREIKGTSVIIYDQTCAAEKRRRRKRGLYPDPPKRVFINKNVCEGCGDCSVQSNCVAVQPVETELGRKRKINQSLCNKDFSCLKGFCPSFVTVHGAELVRTTAAESESLFAALPSPVLPPLDQDYNIMVTGIGGTGVTTIGALIGMAAHLEGKRSAVLDQSGLAQKGGEVLSHVRLANHQSKLRTAHIIAGGADLLLACDKVTAVGRAAYETLNPSRTRAVINTHYTPVADFVNNNALDFHEEQIHAKLTEMTSPQGRYFTEATRTAAALIGDEIATNIFMMGFAWQKGLIPLTAESLLRAISLNGVAVAENVRAFNFGRLAAHDEEKVTDLVYEIKGEQTDPSQSAERTLGEKIDFRTKELTHYQNADYANNYRRLVAQVQEKERLINPESNRLSLAVALFYYKLLAYKDEYEVARLYTDGRFIQEIKRTFAGDYKLRFHLAPPLLSRPDPATGRPGKRQFGPWMFPFLRLFSRFRFLRGTPFDPFGHTAERKQERKLIKEYEELCDLVLPGLDANNIALAEDILSLPALIQGFGPVKEASIQKYLFQKERLTRKWEQEKRTNPPPA